MTDLRAVARACLEAAVAAVDARQLVSETLGDGSVDAGMSGRRLTLVAVGKAAAGMARGALDVLGGSVERGLVIVPVGTDIELIEAAGAQIGARIDVAFAGHPLPDAGSVRAAERVRDLALSLTSGEQLLVLLSGGASALMSLPAGDLSLADLQATTHLLLRAGASIDEVNTVRRQLDDLKGGGLARLADPALVTGLVISDVVGDRLDVIASGPLVPDPTSARDAIDVLRRRSLWQDIPEGVRRYLLAGLDGETGESSGDGEEVWKRVDLQIIGSNEIALQAAVKEATRRGFAGRLLTSSLEGEARAAGSQLASLGESVRSLHQPVSPPACLVAGGETTVTVRGEGKGGRNQELALAAALRLVGTRGTLLAAMGSDGIDGPTDAAGAWVDGETVDRGRQLGLEASAFLEANDAYSYFAALDDLIMTGPTGTNVMDLVILLVE